MSNDSPVVTTSSARALASRRNGARSRGPKTAAGKARSARNALKHGLCAQKLLVLAREDVAAFCTLETALFEELAPAGALQTVLARRVVSAAWRLFRADRMEAEVLTEKCYADGGLGLALVRDGNGTGAVATLLRYRGTALAELMRCLRTLQALQADPRADALPAAPRARRRARPRPKDFVRAPSIGPKAAAAPARRHPAAPAPDRASAATPAEHRANPPARFPAAQPVRPDAPSPQCADTPPALTSPFATKQTRETAPRQHLVARRPAA